MGIEIFPGDKSAGGVKLETNFHTVPRLRKGGDIPLLRLYAFMEWTRTTFFFT
jgi:hypothetical protein